MLNKSYTKHLIKALSLSNSPEFQTKVLVLKAPRGERLPVVVNRKSGIPHPEANRYILRSRRPIVSFKTMKREAEVLCLYLEWIYEGKVAFNISDLDKVSSKQVYGLWEALRKSRKGGAVSGSVHMYRWKVVQNFIKESAAKSLLAVSVKDPTFRNLQKKQEVLLREMERLNYSTQQCRLKGLDTEILDRVIEISRKDSLLNPWIKRDRLRNQLIVDFLIVLGIRAGELLKVEVSDLNLNGAYPTVTIKRSLDDSDDPRRHEPRVKTFGRILELSPHLFDSLTAYLRERRKVPGAKRTKFLFVSNRDGQPLSYARLRDLIVRIEEFDSHLAGTNLTPHSFRRSWNDRFRRVGEELEIDEEMITQSQNYLQGRRLDSSEAYKYAGKHIESVARRAYLDFQNQIFSKSQKS